MVLFEDEYKKVKELLSFGDYTVALKRIIDLTLDTEDVFFYKKISDLLLWVDYNESNLSIKKEKFEAVLEELYQFLSKKEVKKRESLLKTQDLVKAYSKSPFALGPISIEMKEGEIIGLVGENGNGKTTLLRALCGELALTSGKIIYNFSTKDNYDLRTRLIYIPQRPQVWYGSVLDNLYFTASSYGIKGEENLLKVDLIVSRMGLRNYRALKWKDLSSGYKMRFELARMLLRKPDILLIDEPLANLDILSQQLVLEDFKAIAKSSFHPLGIILSSQQLYEVEKSSDKVIFLKQGELSGLIDYSKPIEEGGDLIVEFETKLDKEQLQTLLQKLDPQIQVPNATT